jgi:beta-phosphoglucomutase
MDLKKSFLFDLNGTMIDDMSYHLDIWYDVIVNELGAPLSLEEVRKHMYGKNQEVLVRIFGPNRFSKEELDQISFRKEEKYQSLYKPHLRLLPGLPEVLELAQHHKIKMAIGSAAPPFNIDFVLDNLAIRHYFQAVVSGNDVMKSKPDPETFLKAAGLIDADTNSCIVFEDAPKGVESALRAGMEVVVITTMHSPKEFVQADNILMFVQDYNDQRLHQVLFSGAVYDQKPEAGNPSDFLI